MSSHEPSRPWKHLANYPIPLTSSELTKSTHSFQDYRFILTSPKDLIIVLVHTVNLILDFDESRKACRKPLSATVVTDFGVGHSVSIG